MIEFDISLHLQHLGRADRGGSSLPVPWPSAFTHDRRPGDELQFRFRGEQRAKVA